MFTVKYIEPNGHEWIKEITGVHSFIRPTDNSSIGMRVVEIRDTNGDMDEITSGDLFVMNSNGKTVADYHLGNPYALAEAKQ